MKRVLSLLLIVACTVLAQVQPRGVALPEQEECGCCQTETAGCGTRDCALPTGGGCSALVLTAPAPALRAEARRNSAVARGHQVSFFARFASAPTRAVPERAPVAPVVRAEAPLYEAHCSYLI